MPKFSLNLVRIQKNSENLVILVRILYYLSTIFAFALSSHKLCTSFAYTHLSVPRTCFITKRQKQLSFLPLTLTSDKRFYQRSQSPCLAHFRSFFHHGWSGDKRKVFCEECTFQQLCWCIGGHLLFYMGMTSIETRLMFEVFSLEKLWTFDKVLAPFSTWDRAKCGS